jgi:glucose dehydrogenase
MTNQPSRFISWLVASSSLRALRARGTAMRNGNRSNVRVRGRVALQELLAVLVTVAAGVVLTAQARLDPALLTKPPVDAWPTHHGDYSGRHYSTLSQINQGNVKNLTLAWTYRANTARQGAIEGGVVAEPLPFQLGAGALAGGLLKATPLYVNGVLYMSAPDHVRASIAHT